MSDGSSNVPPKGDFEKADKYINQLVDLINQKKIEVFKTDLKKFDPTSLADHYTIILKDYQIEISHTKVPSTGKSSFVMIFNNLKHISQGSGEKVILAYVYLADSHFSKFKIVADVKIEEKRKAEEEKRFNEALEPINEILNAASEESQAQSEPSGQYHKKEFVESNDRNSDPPQIYQI